MSTLFGHIRGAFTGATKDRPGLLRAANGGLLFLDEVGELGVDEQAMLLRALEEKCFLPMGSDREVTSDFQLIAGTNRDLAQAVRDGRFREDLLARINLWTFCLPGLRERTEDIEPNLDYELDQFASRSGTRTSMSKEVREAFLSFARSKTSTWPANFRDLNACVTRMATLAADSLVKIPILNALIFDGGKDVTVAMVNALRDSNPEVRTVAIIGLGLDAREKIPEEVPAMIACLQDPDSNARCWAAKLLCNYSYAPYDDAVQGQGRVDAMAFAAINNATNNPDQHIRKAAEIAIGAGEAEYRRFNPNLVTSLSEDDKRQITTRINKRVLDAYSRELAISLAELHGTEWRATLHVLDEDGKPVEGAAATISYAIPPEPGEESDSTWKKITGLTDSNGVFASSHSDSSGVLSFAVEKDHYYKSGGNYQFAFPGQFDKERTASNRSPDVKIVLKRRIQPVPMYVNRVDIAHRKRPALDTPVGFDLTVGDFVVPYGQGTNAQLFFTWHTDYDTNDLSATYGKMRSHGGQEVMTIAFPNPGDGIQEFDLPGPFDNSFKNNDVSSELRSQQLAPTNGYNARLIKVSSWMYPNPTSGSGYDHLRKNYLLRVNAVLDKAGNVQTAQYGKIYGDFEEALTTYLNPETNSRELEYDMQHNLGRGGNNFYITY